MDKMRRKNHLYGRIFLGAALLIIMAVPVIISIVLQTPPNWKVIALSLGTLIFFVLGGVIEVITYAPMLGTSGTYLGFITGNLVNLKIPCAVNARELAGVENGSEEGEVVSTISVAVSTIVTTLIIVIGVLAFVPLKEPVFENEFLEPAFGSAFTALFGALAYKYFIKDPLLVPVPFVLCILTSFLKLGTGISILIGGIAAIIMAVLIARREKSKAKK